VIVTLWFFLSLSFSFYHSLSISETFSFIYGKKEKRKRKPFSVLSALWYEKEEETFQIFVFSFFLSLSFLSYLLLSFLPVEEEDREDEREIVRKTTHYFRREVKTPEKQNR